MGRYDGPPDPYEIFQKGCIRVYYPDSPFLFRALMGQLTELESRFIWDTQGDILAANKLEQDWLECGELTRQTQDDGCPSVEECEQTIIDLTVQLEQCQQELEDIENMNITVECNCGCCDTGAPLPPLTGPDGTSIDIEPISINPDDPFGEDVPEWDDGTQTPPDGWTDYQEFIDNKCLAANFMIDMMIDSVEALDLAENKLSIILDVAKLALIVLPTPVGKVSGIIQVLKWIDKLQDFNEEFEEVLDWLQFAKDALEQVRAEAVCLIYSAPDALVGAASVAAATIQELLLLTAFNQMTGNQQTLFISFFETLIEDIVPLAYSPEILLGIPEGYVPPIDCSTCIEVSGYDFTAALISSADGMAVGAGITNELSTVLAAGAAINVTADATQADSTLAVNLDMVPPADSLDWRYVGFTFSLSGTNIQSGNIYQYNPGTGSLWDANELLPVEGTIHLLRTVADTYPDTIPGVDLVNKSTSINIDTCVLTASGIRLGIRTAGPGPIDFTLSGFQWIRKLDRAC